MGGVVNWRGIRQWVTQFISVQTVAQTVIWVVQAL
jgi:hypothetical protein